MKKLMLLTLGIFFASALPVAVSATDNTELPPGQLVKAESTSAVYYIDSDLCRHVFPNSRIFKSWYEDFGNVIELTDEELSAYPLCGTVPYKAGKRLVKIKSDPKVYAVDDGGTLRWVKNERAARALYGEDWSQFVDDLSDAFFANYVLGDDIEGDVDFDKNIWKRIKNIGKTLRHRRIRANQDDGDETGSEDNDGFKGDKVAVCHNFQNKPHTIYIAERALTAHVNHGDTEGSCVGDDFDDDDDVDTTAPVISDVTVSDITDTGATISWETDEPTSYVLYYATASSIDTEVADFFDSASLAETQEVTLTNLTPETDYYFLIITTDEAANTAQSSEEMFATKETTVI